MIPEPTTVATSSPVPRHSAATRLVIEGARRRHASAVIVDHALPILLDELSALRRQKVEDLFGRAA